MAIADWIREATERRRERLRNEGRVEGYDMGYEDADKGRPRRWPPLDGGKRDGDGDGDGDGGASG